MTLDEKTERVLRDVCTAGPVEYADMLGIIERYQPSIDAIEFAVRVVNTRRTCNSNEEAAIRAVRQLQAEEQRRVDIAEQFKGHPCEQQVRAAFGLP